MQKNNIKIQLSKYYLRLIYAASGYARSDAFVALFLQRAEDAKRIYSTIDFSGYTYYGANPNSLLGYDENLLKDSLLDMYSEKNYKGYKDVDFVEMHACGLKVWGKLHFFGIISLESSDYNYIFHREMIELSATLLLMFFAKEEKHLS